MFIEIRARAMRTSSPGDMVEICLDHGHCLHHAANMKINNKNVKP